MYESDRTKRIIKQKRQMSTRNKLGIVGSCLILFGMCWGTLETIAYMWGW